MNKFGVCEIPDVLRVIYFIKILLNIIKFVVPICLIIMVSLDFGKGVISGEKKTGEILKLCSNKLIAAVVIFLIPTIVNFVLGFVDKTTSYESCWANANIGTINSYQVLWDEAVAKQKEEEKKKQEEEKRKEEEEANKKEEQQSSNNNGTTGNSSNNNGTTGNSSNNNSGDNSNTIGTTGEPKKVTDTITKNYYKNFTYYLYVPNGSKTNLPIILSLHGLSERGNDYKNDKSLIGITWGPLNEVRNYNASYNAIIISPQVPSEKSVNNFTKDYISLVNEVANKYKANKNKISILGFSHGCYGVMQIVVENPNYFSAVVPVACGWHPKHRPVEKFTNQPVWAITGEGDGRIAAYAKDGYKPLLDFVNAINDNGGDAKYTYLEDKPHNIFNNTYSILRDSNYDVINWMISKTRGR